MSQHTLHLGDCLEVMRGMADNSVDAVVTDPPYGLSFMGKKWDHNVPSVEVWAECLRVLKPGGHLLAFAGTRTQHRMAVNIEDAGFEIRDMLIYCYGSGFPKSLDVSKAIDQRERGQMVREKLMHFAKVRGIDGKWLESHGVASASSFNDWTAGGHVPSDKNWQVVKAALGITPEEEAAFEREVIGVGHRKNDRDANSIKLGRVSDDFNITAPATFAARQWQGWGTALKPSLEPITLARKPFPGTVAANVLEHGTGAINVDGCRVGAEGGTRSEGEPNRLNAVYGEGMGGLKAVAVAGLGRWPANLITDGSDEVVGLFPVTKSESGIKSLARLFYTSKATPAERQGVTHPTVKPLDLMAYLCRLVTPPGGIVLDPFMGTGTTIKAAIAEGFRAIGIERDPDYFAMAEHRLDGAQLGLPLVMGE